MKNLTKKLLSVTTSLCLASTLCFSSGIVEVKAATFVGFEQPTLQEQSISVTLTEGIDKAKDNRDALNEAFEKASSSTYLKVTIANPGKYYIGDTSGVSARSLIIRSNTEFDLNGSTLIRTGSMANMLQNSNFDITDATQETTGGYDLTSNIVVKNGTFNGYEKGATTDSEDANIINIGHVNGAHFTGLTVINNSSGHLIEICAGQNVEIDNSVFSGFLGKWSDAEGEAIQLDIAYNGVKEGTWNGKYKSDKTVCKNISVHDCTFKDYPSGVGNHHTLLDGSKPLHNSNITISNNTFVNSKEAVAPAIWTYGFDNSLVANNTITGKYSYGILVSGGSTDCTGNTIGSENSPIKYYGIYYTNSSSHVAGKGDTRKDETVTGGKIDSNSIYVSLSDTKTDYNCPISIFGDSSISSITNNTVSNTSGSGIILSGKTTNVDLISGNTITSGSATGIAIAKTKTAAKITNNTITANHFGISITSGGTISSIGEVDAGNTITAAKKSGIIVTGAGSKVGTINSNTITANAYSGIAVANKGNVTTEISANTVSSGVQSIIVTSKGYIKSVDGNILVATTKDGILVTGSGSRVDNITNNTITAKKGNGIMLSNATIATISGNTMEGNKKYGIGVTSKTTVTDIVNNTITGYKNTGIYISSASKVKNIKTNTIENGTGNGIYLTQATVSGCINENVITACSKGGNGIHVTSSGKVSKIQKNTITKCKGYGILVYYGGKCNITKNKLKKNKEAILCKCKGKVQKK